MTAEEFGQAVQAADLAALTRLPGVGKKTAERLVVEMRDKLDKIGIQPAVGGGGVVVPASVPTGADQDAVSALVVLGFRPPEASRMVSKVFEEGMDTEAIIKAALKGTAG
jgi:Holliday junction DNA helicase RuvA